MITSRRDYMLRLLEEIGRLLARISFKREKGDTDDSALESIVFGLQRLFNLDADQIFLLTPAQHFELLAKDESPEFARDKILLYAALCREAGYVYRRQGKTELANAVFTTALRFTLKARARYATEGLPAYAPDVTELVGALSGVPLDVELEQLLAKPNAR